MISKDYQAGDHAQNAARHNVSLLDGSMQPAGEIKTGHAAGSSHAELADPPTEWKCVRLEPQVSEILESMEDAVVAHDSGVIIGFNQRVPELLGLPPEKILWRRFSKFIEPVSQPTLIRWIQASDHYSILVNGLRTGADFLLLQLETVASLLYPGGRRVDVVALVEFAAVEHLAESRKSG
jgi:PAS domain-containing protein